jgi:hypothetical protein
MTKETGMTRKDMIKLLCITALTINGGCRYFSKSKEQASKKLIFLEKHSEHENEKHFVLKCDINFMKEKEICLGVETAAKEKSGKPLKRYQVYLNMLLHKNVLGINLFWKNCPKIRFMTDFGTIDNCIQTEKRVELKKELVENGATHGYEATGGMTDFKCRKLTEYRVKDMVSFKHALRKHLSGKVWYQGKMRFSSFCEMNRISNSKNIGIEICGNAYRLPEDNKFAIEKFMKKFAKKFKNQKQFSCGHLDMR